MLRLPTYQQLSEEQDIINNLPLNGTNLVVGPPGTGKTVMAIYRAEMFHKKQMNTLFLVYNRTLNQYLQQTINDRNLNGVASTLHTWFWLWHKANINVIPPEKKPYIFDWTKVLKNINYKGINYLNRFDHVIIDEGQDFPKEFYLVMSLISDHITVFADENQRIREENSTLDDIRDYLSLEADQEYKLTRNYRNTLPVAKFSRHFYAGLPSGIPELPDRNGPKPRIIKYKNIRDQVMFISKYESLYRDKHIAIFVESTQEQFEINMLLKELGTCNPVQLYSSGNKFYNYLNFSEPGIKILTYASSKGLEFDTVFIPSLHLRKVDPENDHEKMKFYVLLSRARQDLFLFYCGNNLPPLLKKIPEDLYES